MKIFVELKKFGEFVGIFANQRPFNWRNLLALSINCIGIVSNWIYFFCEARSFQDYAETIFVGTAINAMTVIFTFFIWKKQIYFDTLDEYEKIINGSEFNYLIRINLHQLIK